MKTEPINVKIKWELDFQKLITQLEHLTEMLKRATVVQEEFDEAWFSEHMLDQRMKDED